MPGFSEIASRRIVFAGAPAAPPPAELGRAIQRVRERWPDVVPEPREEDKDALVRALLRRITTGDWAECRLREVTSAARAAFDEDRLAREEYAPVRDFLIEETRSSRLAGLLGCMASVHLNSWTPEAAHTRLLGEALIAASARLPARWSDLYRALPEIHDLSRGPERCAERMLDVADPWRALLDLGLVSPHGPGFMDHVHRRFVARMRPRLETRELEHFERMMSWAHPSGRPARARDAGPVISAMLAPWRGQEPSAAFRKWLIDRLTAAWNDPRVVRGGAWATVSEEDRQVLYRWLTGASLEAFLQIVTEAEAYADPTERRMWQSRVTFWRKMHREGAIHAAWAAYSPEGETIAKRRAAATGDAGLRAFGRQTARGSRRYTSLLIMQINDKLVVEGSHNYKVHIFDRRDPECPALYKSDYDCERIRYARRAKSKSHNGDWTGWVRENT